MPFALLGLVSVVSLYPLALVLFGDRRIAVLAMAFLAVSVPFILHARQCRYYVLVILASIWTLYFFVGLARGSRGAVVGFTVALTALFHANHLAFLATPVALAPCALVLRFDRTAIRRAAVAGVLIALLTGPWAVYLRMLGKTEEMRLYGFWENLAFYAEGTSRYTFPIVVVPAFLVLAWFRPLLDARTWRPFVLVLVYAVTYVVAMSAAPWSFYRYTVNLLPVSALLLACMGVAVFRWSGVAGTVLVACTMLTGLLHQLSAAPLPAPSFNLLLEGRSFPVYDRFFPLGNFLHEVSHPYVGPMEELLQRLRAEARPGDRIFITYGDLILQFYTDHEVRGGQSGRELRGWPEPEWVVIRSFFRFGDRPALRADADAMLAWLNDEVPPDHYDTVPMTVTDVPWDDIPEPHLHWYRVPSGGVPMRVHRRRAALPP